MVPCGHSRAWAGCGCPGPALEPDSTRSHLLLPLPRVTFECRRALHVDAAESASLSAAT